MFLVGMNLSPITLLLSIYHIADLYPANGRNGSSLRFADHIVSMGNSSTPLEQVFNKVIVR
jgi:hypothetical protein